MLRHFVIQWTENDKLEIKILCFISYVTHNGCSDVAPVGWL